MGGSASKYEYESSDDEHDDGPSVSDSSGDADDDGARSGGWFVLRADHCDAHCDEQ